MKVSLTLQIVIATPLGLVLGGLVGQPMGELEFLGDIFLRLIQMSVIILIACALISAVGSLTPSELGRVGGRAIGLFVLTSALGATIGLLVVNLIHPGVGVDGVEPHEYSGGILAADWRSQVVELVPKNVVESAADGNVLAVIVFSLLFGLTLSLRGRWAASTYVVGLIDGLNVIIMKTVGIVMRLAPLGVFALSGALVGRSGVSVLLPLAKYLGATFLAAAVVLLIMLTAVGAVVRVNPAGILWRLSRTIAISLSTTSSAASLPTQMAEAEQRLGVSQRVSRLVNPLAMSLNSNGLAMTLAIGAVTVAQFYGIELTPAQQVVIVAASVVTTLGNLLVPGGALVAFAIAFQMAGLPLEGIAILAAVDWLAGMARTLLNVVGDVLVSVLVARGEGEFDKGIYTRGAKIQAVLT